MIEFVLLGTSASAPSIHRGLSAAMALHNDKRVLIDCGEGTQRQLLKSGLGFRRLDTILLTHGHLDHILGLGGLVSTFARWEAMEGMTIYAGEWALERVKALMAVVFGTGEPDFALEYSIVEEGTVLEYDDFEIIAFPVQHRGPGCFGYLLQEKAKRPFLPEEADRLNIPHGPERAALVRGETITLSDGRLVSPDDVLGPAKSGARLAVVGDTGNVEGLVPHVTGVDTIVIEATYLSIEQDLARRFGHITAAEAALLAKEAGAQNLILTHLSRRYHEKDVLREAEAIFPSVSVARDFDRYRVMPSE